MEPEKDDSWERLWSGVESISLEFPKDAVFIGGVAVYLHSVKAEFEGGLIEFSHDGDFVISRSAFTDLRDLEEVTTNRRLSKHQFKKRQIEFDVYVERANTLLVGYAELAKTSQIITGVRAASLEHLLVLKSAAYEDRQGSAKGRKDERDIIRIVILLGRKRTIRQTLLTNLSLPMKMNILAIVSSPEFLTLCEKNVHHASRLRKEYAEAVPKVLP